MKSLFFLTFAIILQVHAVPTYISKSYYDGLGEKFRVETASSFDECKESKKAQKIFIDRTNELREVAIWNDSGKIESAGPTNRPHIRLKVEEVFAAATRGENPCVNKEEVKPQESSEASATPQ